MTPHENDMHSTAATARGPPRSPKRPVIKKQKATSGYGESGQEPVTPPPRRKRPNPAADETGDDHALGCDKKARVSTKHMAVSSTLTDNQGHGEQCSKDGAETEGS